MFHIVTVVHNDRNKSEAEALAASIERWADRPYRLTIVDNSVCNRGFAAGCNLGAADGDEPIIGLLNPDLQVHGPFMATVEEALHQPKVEVAGERFGKPIQELRVWGVREWVCGAAFFVRRTWWAELGGFDERFVWSHEETDFIRRTEYQGRRVASIALPVSHHSPLDDSPEDAAYKRRHFTEAARLYHQKWSRRRA